MDLPDPYLPGALSLLEQLDKKLLVVLRDGRTLIGYLRYLVLQSYFIRTTTRLLDFLDTGTWQDLDEILQLRI